MGTELVSVIVPAFNVASFLPECLDSLVGQTHGDLEIIVIDDGSCDRTRDIAQDYAARDARVRVLGSPTNLGIVHALNLGLARSRGAYIARMDADDISLPERVERQLAYLENHSDIDLVGVSVRSMDAGGAVLREERTNTDWRRIKRNLRFGIDIVHGTWLFRRTLLDKVHGYRNMPGCEDFDFLLRAIAAGSRCCNVPDYVGYLHRIGRPGNSVSTLGIKQRRAQKYALSLYRERVATGKDSYNPARIARINRVGWLPSISYDHSARLLAGAVLERNSVVRQCLLLAGSCLLHPPQLKYLIGRQIIKRSARP